MKAIRSSRVRLPGRNPVFESGRANVEASSVNRPARGGSTRPPRSESACKRGRVGLVSSTSDLIHWSRVHVNEAIGIAALNEVGEVIGGGQYRITMDTSLEVSGSKFFFKSRNNERSFR